MTHRIDPFVDVLLREQGDQLYLLPEEPVTMVRGGKPRKVSKQPLTDQHIYALLVEVAPTESADHIDHLLETQFEYESTRGWVQIRVVPDAGRLTAMIAPLARAPTTSGPPPGLPIPPASPPADAPHAPPERAGDPGSVAGALGAEMGAAIGAVQRAPAAPAAAATPPARTSAPTPAPVIAAPPPRPPRSSAIAAAPLIAHPVAPPEVHALPGDLAPRVAPLLRALVESKSSDLHLRVGEPPIYRTHGELKRQRGEALTAPAVDQLLLSIMPERNQAEWKASGDSDFAYEIPGLARFRVNAARDRRGTVAVFRVIPTQVVSAEELAITKEVQALCALSKGLVLVAGPTGSGKSTTLCALIDLINQTRAAHIITIEAPIEFVHQGKQCLITQRQVGVHTTDFKSALRAAVREDPDVILVGELTDPETTALAIDTAETSCLVFGALRTTTAASTVDRLISQVPGDRQPHVRTVLSEWLKGVIAQTLCRKKDGGLVAAREILLSTPAIANVIREGKTAQIPSLIHTNRKFGMATLNDALLELVEKELVEPDEAYLKAVEKATLAAALKAKGIKLAGAGE
jgi:twitching motility protein PilT